MNELMGLFLNNGLLRTNFVLDNIQQECAELEVEFRVVFKFNGTAFDSVEEASIQNKYLVLIENSKDLKSLHKVISAFYQEYKSKTHVSMNVPGVHGDVILKYDTKFDWHTNQNVRGQGDFENTKRAAKELVCALTDLERVVSEGVRTSVQDQDKGHEKEWFVRFHYANGPVYVAGKSFNATVVIKRDIRNDRCYLYQVQNPSFKGYESRLKNIMQMERVGKDGIVISGKAAILPDKEGKGTGS